MSQYVRPGRAKDIHLNTIGNHGFTLVELMITLAISGIIISGVYSVYTVQQRTYTAQDQVTEMQQNLRAAMDMLMREIRMAGYDPTGGATADITTASSGQLSFTQDETGDGDTLDAGERIDFGFSAGLDADRNGILDDANGDGIFNEVASLARQTGGAGGYQPIAENIQAVEFRYFDVNENVTAVPGNVRSIQISILARAGRPDPGFNNTMTYTPASGISWDLNGAAAGNAPNDNFRRRLLISTVQCRNMGL